MVSHCLSRPTAMNLIRIMSTNAVAGSYRAAVCVEYGKPLQIKPQPRINALQSTQVRVAVDYCGINFADILNVAGKYQVKITTPFVPGWEYCGHVCEVGSEVADIKSGDHIIGFVPRDGAYAEELVTEGPYFKIDDGLSAQEGAAVLTSYGTAYMALVYKAHVKQGDVVLVTAAAGALGLASVDIAANIFGAKVIGVCGGADKCKLVKSYGAYETIDYSFENIRNRVKEITGGLGVDIAVDAVGGKVMDDCVKSMAFEGRLLTLGYAGGDIPKVPANLLLLKSCSIHGLFFGNYHVTKPEVFQSMVRDVLQLWKEHKLKPHIGKIFALSQVNEALQFVSSRLSTGKVLLDCTKQSAL